MIQLQPFIDRHAPGLHLEKADPSKLARYRGHLPPALLELWTDYGFGLYGNGLIQLIDPDRYRQNLWGWLMRGEADLTRLPIAMSAFGTIFYYRRLSDEGDEDVSFLDPHTSESGDLTWSLEEFFNGWCCDDGVISDFLDAGMVKDVAIEKGALENDQMYFFVPALRLGGERAVRCVERGDAAVHLDLLLQMALGG